MDIVLFDTAARKNFFPLTLNRSVADIRAGIVTIKEYWQLLSEAKVYIHTEDYLQPLYAAIPPGEYILIDSTVIPSQSLIERIVTLQYGEAFHDDNGLVAGRTSIQDLNETGSSFVLIVSPTVNYRQRTQV